MPRPLLRAESALCGPRQGTQTCLRLCDDVAARTIDGELRSRAFGHRGLAHLAAYQPDDAETWLQRAIEVARADSHPYAVYEAMHWRRFHACRSRSKTRGVGRSVGLPDVCWFVMIPSWPQGVRQAARTDRSSTLQRRDFPRREARHGLPQVTRSAPADRLG